MSKIIKKILSILVIPAGVLFLMPVSILLILRIPYVQTNLVKGVTNLMSQELNTTISVGSIEFTYFNKLNINDLLIKDQNQDTMIFAPSVKAGIIKTDPLRGVFILGRIEVNEPYLALITDTAGILNLNWYLDKIRGKKDSSSADGSYINIRRIDIADGRFSLINRGSDPANIPVDFNNLRVSGISGTVERLKIRNDSVSMRLRGLSGYESKGFIIRKMNSDLTINGLDIILDEMNLECDSSLISCKKLHLQGDSLDMFSNFTRNVKLDIDFSKSYVHASDLSYFVPFLKGYSESFWLSGRVSGTIEELKGRNIQMSYGEITSFDCDFDLSGLPDINNTFIFLEINDFRSASGDIELIRIPGKEPILLPEPLRKLGVVSFSGTFTGFTTDFVTYGEINTGKGIISTDISLRPEGRNRFRIMGLVKGTGIDLGDLSGSNNLLGNMTIEANVDGFTDSFKTFNATLSGTIDSVEINSYLYRNVILNGSFKDKAWDGNIRINDRNLKMDLSGMLDFNGVLPQFDFTLDLKKARLHNINIDKTDTSSAASFLLIANLEGNNIDNLDGEIKVLNSRFRKFNNNLELSNFSLTTSTGDSKPDISLTTDFIDAELYGRYSFSGMKKVVNNIMATLIPSKYADSRTEINPKENDFNFEIKFKDTDRLNRFLETGLEIAKNSIITGAVKSDSLIKIEGNARSFSFGTSSFNDMLLDARFSDTIFNAVIKSKSFNLAGISDLKSLIMNLHTVPDSFSFDLNWDNKETLHNSGNFRAAGVFNRSGGNENKLNVAIDLLPGEVYSRSNLWKIYPSTITVDSSSVRLKMFTVRNNENHIIINGAISEDPADTLSMSFNGINLNPLNNLYEKRMGNPDNIIHLAIGGTLNGKANITNIYRNFMFESDLVIKDFSLLESRYGDIRLFSLWNKDKELVDIEASNNFEGARMFNIRGSFDPRSKNIDLFADADDLPIDALNPLLGFFASDINGKATGRVHLTGELSEPELTGSLMVRNAGMKVDYVQARYTFTDSIRFVKGGIKFNNIQFSDDRGNNAFLTGTVYHNHFKDYNVDLSLKTNNCMVLNTRSKDNELFYGTAFASGVTTLKTEGSLVRFDISARTGKNTRFYIPLNTSSSVTENKFISFVEPQTGPGSDITGITKETPVSSTAMEIAFDLDITPDAEVQLIMDPKTGDIMKGTGTGKLNISLDRKNVLKIFGDYVIENGSYLFTLGNIINKSFDVEEGGTITFTGDVDNAEINIKAIYKTKASLYEIMPDLLSDEKQKEKIPVECHLLLTGRLFNPRVGFDIYLPTADEETRAYLKSMIKSDEDMSRQFLFLLVMNSFYADQSIKTSTSIGSSAVEVTTMEMLSSQLSNWLSQISNDFDIGVAYRPGSTDMPNSQELQVALSTQLLNDKVVINGNFDVAGTPGSAGNQTAPGTSTFTGAFDIEYKINEKIKFKVFNRSNDNFYTDNGIQYTQGIGLFYREDFNKLKDLFKKKKEKSEMK